VTDVKYTENVMGLKKFKNKPYPKFCIIESQENKSETLINYYSYHF